MLKPTLPCAVALLLGAQLQSVEAAELRSREVLTVVVQDPNPLLFTYTWNGVTEAPTQDYQSGLKLAEVLGQLAATLQRAPAAQEAARRALGPRGASPRAAAPPGIEQQIQGAIDNSGLSAEILADFQKDLKDISDRLNLVPGPVNER